MKLLLLFSYGCCIVACIQWSAASPNAKANAEADPEPHPLVGIKIKHTCIKSIVDAPSHTVLCQKIANRVVDKISHACHKAFEYGCTLARFAVKYESCYKKMNELICPAVQPKSLAIEAAPDAKTEAKISSQEPKDDGQHPFWVGRFIIKKCDKYLRPIADDVTDNGKVVFNATTFCNQLAGKGKDKCKSSLIGQCDLFPNEWTIVRDICKRYVVPRICK